MFIATTAMEDGLEACVEKQRIFISGVAGFSPDAASLYLKPGDVMECEIERIGVLRNPVVSWQEGHGESTPPRIRW